LNSYIHLAHFIGLQFPSHSVWKKISNVLISISPIFQKRNRDTNYTVNYYHQTFLLQISNAVKSCTHSEIVYWNQSIRGKLTDKTSPEDKPQLMSFLSLDGCYFSRLLLLWRIEDYWEEKRQGESQIFHLYAVIEDSGTIGSAFSRNSNTSEKLRSLPIE